MINVGTSLCLFDSANGFDKMEAVKASTTVQNCDKGKSLYMENQFFLELANLRNRQKCAPIGDISMLTGKKKTDSKTK